MNTTERAAAIRAALKAQGISNKLVSVRANYFSMGSAIDVRIKDARVSKALVDAIANGHEDIRRCDITHDILSGGNRYVSVSYTHDVAQQVARTWHDVVAAAFAQAHDGYLIPVEGSDYMVGVGHLGHGVGIWSRGVTGSHVCEAYDVDSAAQEIGLRMIAKAAA